MYGREKKRKDERYESLWTFYEKYSGTASASGIAVAFTAFLPFSGKRTGYDAVRCGGAHGRRKGRVHLFAAGWRTGRFRAESTIYMG